MGILRLLIYSTLAVSGLFSCLGVIGQVQQADLHKDDTFWVNLPSCPLRISLSANNRFLTLDNHSDKQVLRYRLGCVVEEQGKYRVLRKMKVERTNLVPVDPANDKISFESLDPHKEFSKMCKKGAGRLAVIEVGFIDGSTWKAPRNQ